MVGDFGVNYLFLRDPWKYSSQSFRTLLSMAILGLRAMVRGIQHYCHRHGVARKPGKCPGDFPKTNILGYLATGSIRCLAHFHRAKFSPHDVCVWHAVRRNQKRNTRKFFQDSVCFLFILFNPFMRYNLNSCPTYFGGLAEW